MYFPQNLYSQIYLIFNNTFHQSSTFNSSTSILLNQNLEVKETKTCHLNEKQLSEKLADIYWKNKFLSLAVNKGVGPQKLYCRAKVCLLLYVCCAYISDATIHLPQDLVQT